MRSDLKGIIDKAAYAIYRRYRLWADCEDIRQEMWVWASRQPPDALEAMETNPLRWKLKDAGEAYARREKAARSGYTGDDEVFYAMRVIRELLPQAMSTTPDVLPGVDDREGSKPPKGTAHAFEYETAIADLRAAYQTLPADERDLLHDYADGGDVPELDVTRAIRRMQRKLGGRRPTRHLEENVG